LKRALFFSVVLHLLIICIIFFLKPDAREKEKRPLIVEIVTPQDMQPPQQQRQPEDTSYRRLRIPKETPPPKTLAEQPSRQARQRKQGSGVEKQAAQSPRPQSQSSVPRSGVQAPFALQKHYETPKSEAPQTARNKLFDRDVIAKAARSPEAKDESTITFNTKDYRYYGYMQRLREKIENIWRYPPEAASRGLNGDLEIKFTIAKNGRLSAIELTRTSGHKILDDAALKALRDAEPFWPLPDEWGRDGLTITGHFVYSLRGYYLR